MNIQDIKEKAEDIYIKFIYVLVCVVVCWLLWGLVKHFFHVRENGVTDKITYLVGVIDSEKDPIKLAYAAHDLADFGKSARGAVPGLIKLLEDDTPLAWETKSRAVGPASLAGAGATLNTTATSIKAEALNALTNITDKDFGYDKAKWNEWWSAGGN